MFTFFLESKKHQKLRIPENSFLAKIEEAVLLNAEIIFINMWFLYILMGDVIMLDFLLPLL